jgi:hypothetical protein
MFSGTMAELLRLLGIPARVAEGFTTGGYDRDSKAYRVTDHDAHAWVEAYFPGYGWLPFDPTPTRALDTRSSVSSARYDAPGAVRGESGGGGNPRQDSFHHGETGLFPTGSALGGVGSGASAAHRTVPLAILLVVAIALLLLAAKRALVLVGHRSPDPRARAAACRTDIVSFALDQGVTIGPALSHREVAETLRREFGVDADAWVAAMDRARYAPPARAAATGHELRERTRELRRALRRSCSLKDRLVGAVSPRSVFAVRAGMRSAEPRDRRGPGYASG